jgi:hypothetical protein
VLVLEGDVTEVDRYTSSTGNVVALRTDGLSWEVVNLTVDGEISWTETSVSGDHPFTEAEARAEFERWRV